MKRSRPDARDQAKRAALNALRRARRAAALTGAKLSEWEGDFLGSVEDRIRTYGRAFGDPEKGAPGQSLSMLQHLKLKEITVKAKGGAQMATAKSASGKSAAVSPGAGGLRSDKPFSKRGLRRRPSGGLRS
jgi:hypothetical protein